MPTEIWGPVGAGASVSAPVTPAQGGTGTATVFTPGSVVYAGASGVYSQDNPTLFHNDATNQNGVGTNLPSATLEVADTTVLAAESLTNPNLTAGASWTRTGDMALAVNAATYTHATGVGTLSQASGTLAIAGIANNLYSFTYTISNLSAFVNIPIVTITTGFALTAVPLVINQAGVHTVIFRSAAVPGNFVINVTSASAGAFTMDTFSLKHVIGGDLTVNGNAQVNGTLTATALAGPLTGNVTGNVSGTAATVTGAAQTNITSVGTLSGLTVTAAPTFSALTAGRLPYAGTAGLMGNSPIYTDGSDVGIGASPGQMFELIRAVNFSFGLNNTGANGNRWAITNVAGVGNAGGLQFYNAGMAAYQFAITNAGYFGIGTISPTSPLQVVTLPTYTTNATALAGGLTAGAFFKVNVAGEYFVHVVV
jgi:hypothetical protein